MDAKLLKSLNELHLAIENAREKCDEALQEIKRLKLENQLETLQEIKRLKLENQLEYTSVFESFIDSLIGVKK